MNIGNVLNENLIDLDMNVTSKEEAIKHLANLLVKNKKIIDKDIFIKDVYERENEGKTGLGNGIAIPHGKSDSVKETSIAIGRTKSNLKWESYDNLPVHLVILFAVRNIDKTTIHLKLLSQVAMALADDTILEKLLNTNNKLEIIKLLSRKIKV